MHIDRGPTSTSYEADRIRISFNFSGNGRVDLPGPVNPGYTFAGNLTVSAPLVPTPDFSINPDTIKVDIGITKAEIRGLPISVKTRVREAIDQHMGEIRSAIAAGLNAARLSERVKTVWNRLHTTRQVANNPRIWVAFEPRAVKMGSPRFGGDPLQFVIAVDANTRVHVQDSEPTVVVTQLQPLVVQPDLAGTVSISLPVLTSLASISDRVNEELGKESVELAPGTTVKFRKATVGTCADEAVLRIEFTARNESLSVRASGTMYLLCRPMLDASNQQLRLVGLHFSVETESILLRMAKWLLSNSIKTTLERRSVINLSGPLAEARAKANEQIARIASGNLAVRGRLATLDIADVRVFSGQAFLIVKATGEATIAVE